MMKCSECGKGFIENVDHVQYDGEGKYYHCPFCEAKNYIKEDSTE